MCGIVGVIGATQATPMMIEALKRLEYRGYDSAGVAALQDGRLDRRRAVGKLSALTEVIESRPLSGRTGVGHTRWATHGAANIANAHPHMTDRVAVVHNGIIENYRELRQELEEAGCAFESETDTEVVAQMLTWLLEKGRTPQDAAAETLKRLDGAFALVFLFEGHDDLLIAARRGSPLAIGYGDSEMFIGSDALALAPMTHRVCYLEEGDWAVVTRDDARIFTADGAPANREVKSIALSTAIVDKGEHRHFMAKEIHEQPSAMAYTLAPFLGRDRQSVVEPSGTLRFDQMDRISIIACGTAHYAGAIARYWFESLAGLPVDIDIASEFRYRDPVLDPKGVAFFISQSGETADTLAALRYCKEAGQTIVSVVNVPTSSIARESDLVLPTLAGPEIGVASTKAFTSQLVVLASMAILAARQRGRLSAAEESALVEGLTELPTLLSRALNSERQIARIAASLARSRDVLYLGRGPLYPLALEAALKLKEISYIHAEGYASGELKHGPIALVDETVPVVVLAPTDPLFGKTVSNMQEVMGRGGRVILISDRDGVLSAGDGVWHTVQMPQIDHRLAPILYAAPAQLLAYHTAVHKGTDVDQPRNLAKSVTVE